MTTTDADAETIPEIVASLRQDPILVQQILGNGHTSEVHAALTKMSEQVGQPVYVALVQLPDGLRSDRPNDELLRILHQRLDEPGLYVVATQESITAVEAYDIPLDGTTVSLGRYDAQSIAQQQVPEDSYVGPAGETALVLEVAADEDQSLTPAQVREVTDQRFLVASNADEPSSYDTAVEPGTPLVFAVAAGVTVFFLAWRLLRARNAPPSPEGTRTPTKNKARKAVGNASDIDTVRIHARREVAKLERSLRGGGQPSDVEAAQRCRDVAVDLADSVDRLDVVGALVLARTGRTMLRQGDATYHPCFLNPLHGEGTQSVRLDGAAGSVPCCTACAHAAARDTRPDALLDGTGRRARPYYEGTTVWARTGFGSLVDDLWNDVDGSTR